MQHYLSVKYLFRPHENVTIMSGHSIYIFFLIHLIFSSGYIDLSHFKFREVREFLQKYELSRHFDEVIFFSVDNNGLDSATLAKLEFYIDKLAKSSAAKARHQSVAIVTVGTSGIKRLKQWLKFDKRTFVCLILKFCKLNYEKTAWNSSIHFSLRFF